MKLKSIFLSVILLIPMLFSMPAYAADTENNDLYKLYSCLTANQKAIYDAFSKDPLAESFIVDLPEPFQYESAYSDATFEFFDDMYEPVCAGLYAFAYDYPQYLWFSTFSLAEINPDVKRQDNGKYIITQSHIKIIPKLNTAAFSSNADLRAKNAQMMDVVNSIEISGNTIYERVKSINDTIVKMVTYDPNLGESGENPSDHYPTGVFLNPHIAVCEGYAAAFKMLCDRENIPCILVVGKLYGYGHAWNYVQLENGTWYAVDSTRSDNGEYIYYDDFFAGQKTIANHFAGSDDDRSFSGSHSPDGKLWLFDTFAYQYPMLSDQPFSIMLLAPDSKASISMDSKKLIIPPNSVADQQAEAPSGYIFMAFDSKTGSAGMIINTTDMSQQTNYTIIMKGDTVPDAVVDESDYNAVIDTAIGKAALADGSNEYEAGDINGDGVVDLFDASEIDLIIAGKK